MRSHKLMTKQYDNARDGRHNNIYSGYSKIFPIFIQPFQLKYSSKSISTNDRTHRRLCKRKPQQTRYRNGGKSLCVCGSLLRPKSHCMSSSWTEQKLFKSWKRLKLLIQSLKNDISKLWSSILLTSLCFSDAPCRPKSRFCSLGSKTAAKNWN